MKKLTKSLVVFLMALVLTTVLSASASAADVGRVTGLKASAITNNSVALVWNKIAAADGYRIQYRENNGAWITLSDTLETNAYVVKNLKLGSTYSFRVNAYDLVEVKVPILGVISSEKDHANYSTVVSVSNTIGKVTDLKVSGEFPTYVKLSWSKVNGATGYLIQKKVGDTWKNVKTTTSTSYTVKNLKTGSTTSFRVKAYATVDGQKVYGSVSSTVKATTKVPAINNFKVTVKSTSSVQLSWDKRTTVTGYQIYRKVGSGDWKKIKTITKNSTVSFTNKSLTLGTKYQYKIRGYYETDTKTYYGAYTAVKSVTPTLPKVIGVDLNSFLTKNKAVITWDKIDGAKGYHVYDYSSGKGVQLASVTVNKATITVADNSVYKIKVRAYTKNSSGSTVSGTFSDIYELYTTPATVSNLSYEALDDNSVKLTWNKVENAHGYKIEVINSATSKWELYTLCADNSYVISDSAKLPGSNFRVSAFVRNSGISLYGGTSNIITAKIIQRPDIYVSNATSNTVTLTWTTVREASTYVLERYNFEADTWDLLKETTDTQYSDRVPEGSASMGGLYRVYAKSKDGSRSSYSNEVTAYTDGLKVTQDGVSQTITWPEVEGASKYRIYIKNAYGDRSYLGSIIPVSSNSATITLTPSSVQSLVVHGYAANGDYAGCAVEEVIIKTEKLKILDKSHYNYDYSVNSQILLLVDSINKTKHETGEVTVTTSSVVDYDTEKFYINDKAKDSLVTLLSAINAITGFNKNENDLKNVVLSGKETSNETVTFEDCIGKNELGKTVNLAKYIDPSDEECAYLYNGEVPTAWKEGVKSITVTETNGGGYNIVMQLYKEEYGLETNINEAHYHKGFATTVASLGQFSTGSVQNQLTTVGDTTITAVINADGTLDSYKVSSPYTMKMRSPVNGIIGITSFGMQIKGNVSSVYTFTR